MLLKEDGKEITDDESIAQEMNLYFSSVFTQEQSNLPEFGNIINDRLSSILCTTSEVEKYLKTLNAHKYPGPVPLSSFLIPPRILKECAHELSTPLRTFFNKSFTTRLLPTDWKMTNITPIHKKGHKHKKENYRQISVTSVVCKVAENIVRSRVKAFWSDHQVLNPNQFGYLKGKSSLLNCLVVMNHHWYLIRHLPDGKCS